MTYLCNRELSIQVHHLTPCVSPLYARFVVVRSLISMGAGMIEGVNGHARLTQPQAV